MTSVAVKQGSNLGTVYLLHFAVPLKHARHYVGFTTALDDRIQLHRKGRGARLLEVLAEQGIAFELVRTWEGVDRHFERRIHLFKNSPRLCPTCSPLALRRKAVWS